MRIFFELQEWIDSVARGVTDIPKGKILVDEDSKYTINAIDGAEICEFYQTAMASMKRLSELEDYNRLLRQENERLRK